MTTDNIAACPVELKPCPFCGADGIVIPHATVKSVWFKVHCEWDGCGVFTALRATEAEAIAAWNQRTPANPVAGGLVERERRYAMALESTAGHGAWAFVARDAAASINRLCDALEALGGGVEADEATVERVAQRLIDQRDEPLHKGDTARLHYWRGKAIQAARDLTAIAALKEPTNAD